MVNSIAVNSLDLSGIGYIKISEAEIKNCIRQVFLIRVNI
jgi:hypothetical protein